jgi:hypothetical protein
MKGKSFGGAGEKKDIRNMDFLWDMIDVNVFLWDPILCKTIAGVFRRKFTGHPEDPWMWVFQQGTLPFPVLFSRRIFPPGVWKEKSAEAGAGSPGNFSTVGLV